MTQYEALLIIFQSAIKNAKRDSRFDQADRIVSQMLQHCNMPDDSNSENYKDK